VDGPNPIDLLLLVVLLKKFGDWQSTSIVVAFSAALKREGRTRQGS